MRSATFVLGLLLFGGPALGQSTAPYQRAPGPLRDAGTFHAATRTWTRGRNTAAIAPSAIYRNDVHSGYFSFGWEGCWTMDEVTLPGPFNPQGGAQEVYRVDGFTFSYCSSAPTTIDWYFGLWEGYTPCDDPVDPDGCLSPLAQAIHLPGAPGGAACWTVTIDLSGGYEACLRADGGGCAPGYQGGGLGLDHAAFGFGWFTNGGVPAGPVLAGDPGWHPAGDGTCYDPLFLNACGTSTATGLGAYDMYSISDHDPQGAGLFVDCTSSNGCYFFGGYVNTNGCAGPINKPLSQFAVTLYADCDVACPPTTVYCDESQNPHNAADLSIDTTDSGASSILLALSNGPPGQFCYLIVGSGEGVVRQPPGFQYWHRQAMGQPSSFSSALAVYFE